MRDVYRVEVINKVFDTRGEVRKKKLENLGFAGKIGKVQIVDVYTVDKDIKIKEIRKFAISLTNPLTQLAIIRSSNNQHLFIPQGKFSWAIEIGFLPGVTDNVGNTAKEMFEDLLKIKFNAQEGLYTSCLTLIDGRLSRNDVQKIALIFANPLIQRMHIKDYQEFTKDRGMDFIIPQVKLKQSITQTYVDLNVSDEELSKIGKQGIANADGTRRGPLALDLTYLKRIKSYFKKKGRKPTDIELESLAQTWSEHCKHTIFNNPLDEVKDGLFNTYIKRATEEIRKRKSRQDFCVSVFEDNSGAIVFDDYYLITHKVETHNTPCALDPFGGAVTGIVGVNRDTIGFGLGAKPIANYYGFCLSSPRSDNVLYKGANFSQKMLSSRRIMEGVIEGVNVGGNQSGIPTPMGFLYFDERYRGKPLVFVGTIGLIPKKVANRCLYIKKARPADYIVMVGGRVGKDGIHGATFSSEALDMGSPVTAVQIGDPITQKKLSDVLIKEARDKFLYNSITDNGAGGLSCSVAEMAKEAGGARVDLEKVPLKYPHLTPWEIWISESQERMTMSVPKKKWAKLADLMKRRGVEATIIGEFNRSGRCEILYKGKTIMDIELDFLHYGLPKKILTTANSLPKNKEPVIPKVSDLTKSYLEMLGRLNIASYSFISSQYDHTVGANLVLGPLQGRGQVNADAAVLRPVLDSQKGIVTSYGVYPSYSDIDTYHMAAASLDTAIRGAVAVGADIDNLALLDNFCWCDSNNPYRLGQLKRAAKACYDLALIFQTPFISGKDSMYNDFIGFDDRGFPMKISIPPTLLITSVGVVEDIDGVISPDVKCAGDLIYLLGETYDEMGGSEYFAQLGYVGNCVPKVEAKRNKKLYKAIYKTIQKGLITSSISINRGGLGVALAKMSMAGMFGVNVFLKNIPGKVSRDDFALYSESQGRILVTIAPQNKKLFEKTIAGNSFALMGKVREDKRIIVRGLAGNVIVRTDVGKALNSYRKTFEGY